MVLLMFNHLKQTKKCFCLVKMSHLHRDLHGPLSGSPPCCIASCSQAPTEPVALYMQFYVNAAACIQKTKSNN